MNGAADENSLPPPADEIAIFILGLAALFFGVPGFPAYFMGRAYREKLARGLVRRSSLAEAGYIMGSIGLIIFFAVIAVLLLALIGVVGLARLFA